MVNNFGGMNFPGGGFNNNSFNKPAGFNNLGRNGPIIGNTQTRIDSNQKFSNSYSGNDMQKSIPRVDENKKYSNSYAGSGMNSNIRREDPSERKYSNSYGGQTASNSKEVYTSIDGQKFEHRDDAIRANQDYYRKMMSEAMKKGNQ